MGSTYDIPYARSSVNVQDVVPCGNPYAKHRYVVPRKSAAKPLASAPAPRAAPVPGTVGDRIARALEELGKTREWLADAVAGGRAATVYEWIRNEPVPQVRHLASLSAALQVPLGELIDADVGELMPPFRAWDDFMETPEGETATEEERRALASVVWPRELEPTVFGYQTMLMALRGGTRRRQRGTETQLRSR